MPTVYSLTNKVSKKKFIGISNDSDKKTLIDKACQYNRQIKSDISNIGIDNFSIKILFESDDRNEINKVKRKEMAAIENSYHSSNNSNQRSIYLNNDTIDMINYYMENKDCSFSKAIDELVGIGGLFFLSNQYNA